MSQRITVPTADEIRQTAELLNLDLNDQEVEMFGAFMEPMVADYQTVEALDAPSLPVKYPREAGYRPDAAENTLNAWYYKSEIRGAPSGKLAGKRVVIKDNVSVANVPMMNGAKVWEGFIPNEDATVVTRVLDAGATIVGKAVCENFCFSGGSHTSATGPVRNPHNEAYMAGGSSSGCAAIRAVPFACRVRFQGLVGSSRVTVWCLIPAPFPLNARSITWVPWR